MPKPAPSRELACLGPLGEVGGHLAIAAAARSAGRADPTKTPLVADTLRGIARQHAAVPAAAARQAPDAEGARRSSASLKIRQGGGRQVGESETCTIISVRHNRSFYLNSFSRLEGSPVSRTALYSFMGTRGLRPRGVTVYFRTDLVGTLS